MAGTDPGIHWRASDAGIQPVERDPHAARAGSRTRLESGGLLRAHLQGRSASLEQVSKLLTELGRVLVAVTGDGLLHRRFQKFLVVGGANRDATRLSLGNSRQSMNTRGMIDSGVSTDLRARPIGQGELSPRDLRGVDLRVGGLESGERFCASLTPRVKTACRSLQPALKTNYCRRWTPQ